MECCRPGNLCEDKIDLDLSLLQLLEFLETVFSDSRLRLLNNFNYIYTQGAGNSTGRIRTNFFSSLYFLKRLWRNTGSEI